MFEPAEMEVTIEVCNYCSGTCTGCMLSVLERKANVPMLSADDLALAMDRVAEHREKLDLEDMRVIMGFGDVIALPLETQEVYYGIARARGLPIAATMTFVDDGRENHYRRSLDLLLKMDETAIFDITVDPVRLERNSAYSERLRAAYPMPRDCHVQMLLSEAVIDRYTPEQLAGLWHEVFGDQPVVLAFTPTLSNIDRKNYRYAVTSASDYANRFYGALPGANKQNDFDLARFNATGSFTDFLWQRCHIGPHLDVFPVSYTAFGEVNLDTRNRAVALGNLRNHTLSELLNSVAVMRLAALNSAWMERGEFGCAECRHRIGCEYNGVGLVRRLYKNHEMKTGSCYGPAGLLDPDALQERLLSYAS